MKQLLTIVLCLTWMVGVGQAHYTHSNIVTDSVIWITIDTLRQGNSNCHHEWVYSEEHPYQMGCLVLHWGWHCDWDDMCRDAICRKCKMKISQREKWYQHEVTPPKSEYELLDEPEKLKVTEPKTWFIGGRGVSIDTLNIPIIRLVDTIGINVMKNDKFTSDLRPETCILGRDCSFNLYLWIDDKWRPFTNDMEHYMNLLPFAEEATKITIEKHFKDESL